MGGVLPDDPVSPGELLRELTRVADRLRVMGPRWGARQGPEAEADLAAVRGELQRLADLAATAEGREPLPLPVLGAHALSDQLLVLGHDVLRVAAVDGVIAVAHDVLAGMRRRM